MHKHAEEPPELEASPLVDATVAKGKPVAEQATSSSLVKSDSPAALRELLEKNLKWSQIIYEQNRKMNTKLMWAAIGSWLRLFVILVPFVLAVIFLPPFVRDFKDRYFHWLQSAQSGKATNVDELINLLPLNAAERDRVKAMLK